MISFELDGQPFGVTIFLGDVQDDNVFNFFTTDTAVGQVFNFSSQAEGRGTGEGGCASCAADQADGVLASGQVILTGVLIKLVNSGIIPDLEEDTIQAYLKENLHWRIKNVSTAVQTILA